MDTRYWCSRGTIGTIDDQGDFHPDDPHAIWIGPEGVECDVKLEPLEQMVTALWSKGDAESSDIWPIRPGDQVLVECPGGDLMTPVITHILHSRSAKQPMASGVPLFDNKRRLIYLKTSDLDIRCAAGKASIAAGPTSVWVKQDKIQLGDDQVTEQAILGTSYRSAEDTMLDDLQSGIQSMQAAAIGPLAGLQGGLTLMDEAITAFKLAVQANNGFKSDVVLLK
jgi:phage baseplate assembly protein gpV